MIAPDNTLFLSDEIKNIYDFCHAQHKSECLIVGNGPSSSSVVLDDKFLEKNFICRCNWFFLEKNKNFSNRVDAYFYSIFNEYIYKRIFNYGYNIKSIFRPFRIIEDSTLIEDLLYSKKYTPVFDHWHIISSNKKLAYMMMHRPLPTQGMQMIAFAAIIGFRIINIAGIDFYDDKSKRYNYSIPPHCRQYLEEKDVTPGYEENHKREKDFDFLKTIINEYDIKINCMSDMYIMKNFLHSIGDKK